MRRIAAHLYDRDLTLLTQARMLDETVEGVTLETITLPGFSLFGEVSEFSAPRPLKDLDDILAVYEEYVDRPLGAVRSPDKVARRATSPAVAKRFFGPHRKPWNWWIPAVQLIAIASRLSGSQAKVETTRVVLELGGYRMEVARRGCWSNFRGRMVVAKVAAGDADASLLEVADLHTNHALARALARIKAPTIILQAANAAIRAEKRGDLAPITPSLLHYTKPPGRGPSVNRFGPADLIGAVTACQEIMEGGGEGSLWDLYHCAVPVLMTGKTFISSVTQLGQNRGAAVSDLARERMTEVLEKLSAGL